MIGPRAIDMAQGRAAGTWFEWGIRWEPSMRDEFDRILGRRLRRRRRLLGLTQEELGAACGVRFQQIQKYESAANRVSAFMLWRLAVALEVDLNYFVDGLPMPQPVAAEPVTWLNGRP
jgi:transcriptional regulator with XRE-family HTH domain